MSNNLIKAFLGTVEEGPESVDLDGTNDYLSRSSDFDGNTDSKTFTFSCWVYRGENISLHSLGEIGRFKSSIWNISSNNQLVFTGQNAGGTPVLSVTLTPGIPENAFYHILLSCDMFDINKRYLYVNDVLVTPSWSTYVDSEIDFTRTSHAIFADVGGTSSLLGRGAHCFLDYTYRDLSIEANRRLFITEDLKPAADLESLNPIMYFPLTDETDLTTNLGTGGDMVQNGIIVQSQRGPNQDNCVASEFDGVADQLSLASITGITDSKTATFSGVLRVNSDNRFDGLLITDGTLNNYVQVRVVSQTFILVAVSGGSTVIYSELTGAVTKGSNIDYQVRFDLNNSSERQVILGGRDITNEMTWTTYTDTLLALTGLGARVGVNANLVENDATNGELYFDTTYASDLAVFRDADNNRPKPVRQVLDETGNTPLVALPIRADNPGLNLGTGGDFTEVSAPFVGARGMSEFWARSVVVDSTNYLTYSPGVLCASLIKAVSTDSGATWTISFLNNTTVTDIGNGTDNGMVGFYFGTSEVINWDETNKLRFVDALGYPIDIETDGNTLIYHKFNDSSAFNENLGSAGNPTENGTVTQGADVNP